MWGKLISCTSCPFFNNLEFSILSMFSLFISFSKIKVAYNYFRGLPTNHLHGLGIISISWVISWACNSISFENVYKSWTTIENLSSLFTQLKMEFLIFWFLLVAMLNIQNYQSEKLKNAYHPKSCKDLKNKCLNLTCYMGSRLQHMEMKWYLTLKLTIIMKNFIHQNHITLHLKLKKQLMYNCYVAIPWVLELLCNYHFKNMMY